jgi:hypothetical protein
MTTTSIEFALDRGERQLWAGIPRQGLMLTRADRFMIPFSAMWGGFACFWEYMVIRSNGPLIMKLWGVPFVAIGLNLMIGRFFLDSRRRARTAYAVTSERIIIATGMGTATTQSLPLRSLGSVTLQEQPDGTGSIVFGTPSIDMTAVSGTRRPMTPTFEMIPDAKRVYDLIREAQRA